MKEQIEEYFASRIVKALQNIDLRGNNMNAMSTDLTKEDLQLIYLLLHKVPISYTMTTGMEYEVLDLIEKVGKEIDNRLLKGE